MHASRHACASRRAVTAATGIGTARAGSCPRPPGSDARHYTTAAREWMRTWEHRNGGVSSHPAGVAFRLIPDGQPDVSEAPTARPPRRCDPTGR